jgi:uncharacterized protein involved in response to NO
MFIFDSSQGRANSNYKEEAMSAIPRLQPFQGPAILSYGFRPFFLAGAFYAGLGILIWLPLFFGDFTVPTAFSPVDWHIHEMLYGYLPAVVTGFLLTAIPNWTGRFPLQGRGLAVLVVLWIAGRVAVWFSSALGPVLAGAIDALFLLTIAAVSAREVIVGRNWRNLPPIGILLVFFGGNVLFHIEDRLAGRAEFGTRLGIAAAVALISLIGGRIVPSFTRNWLARENPGRFPVPFGRFDVAVLVLSVLALALWIVAPEHPGTGAVMLLAGAAQAVRVGRWAGERTWRDRLVLVLHLGYAFVPLGFLLVGSAILFPQQVPLTAGIHAWTVGAIGTMTLAVMTRATLGHTGQPLAADRLTHIIYACVIIAALVRVAAAFATAMTVALLHLAAGAWIAAFWLFAIGYGPLLCRPRAKR